MDANIEKYQLMFGDDSQGNVSECIESLAEIAHQLCEIMRCDVTELVEQTECLISSIKRIHRIASSPMIQHDEHDDDQLTVKIVNSLCHSIRLHHQIENQLSVQLDDAKESCSFQLMRAEQLQHKLQCLEADIEGIHLLLDADESRIIRNHKDGLPQGRPDKPMTLEQRVKALCTYASDWKHWCQNYAESLHVKEINSMTRMPINESKCPSCQSQNLERKWDVGPDGKPTSYLYCYHCKSPLVSLSISLSTSDSDS